MASLPRRVRVPSFGALWHACTVQMTTGIRVRAALFAMLFALISTLSTTSAIAIETAPRITSASASANELTIAWDYVGQAQYFTAQYSCDGGVQWTTVDWLLGDVRTFTLQTETPAENCVVRIAAKIDNINTAFSEPVYPTAAQTPAPMNVQVDATTATITWEPSIATNIVGYEVQVSSDEGITWTTVGKTEGGLTGLQLPELADGAAFRVVAIATDGQRFTSEIQRALDAAAADYVRTSTMPTGRIALFVGSALVLAALTLVWLRQRRKAQGQNAGFEDFDALTRS